MKPVSGKTWIELYKRNPEDAWVTFLRDYHALLMAVIDKMTYDPDERMELYTYATEKLKQEHCKRLTGYFSKPRKYNFETWIAVVVRNCCLDWLRKEKGRQRLAKCIDSLTSIEQTIFRYIYWNGYSYETVYELIKSRHGFRQSFAEMRRLVDHIAETLQKSTGRRTVEGRNRSLIPLPLDSTEIDKIVYTNPHHTLQEDNSPEEQVIHNDSAQFLKQAIDSLPSEQKLIIQLYFYRGLTLQEITRILKQKNLWRVHRKLRKAIKALHKKLKAHGIGPSDLEIL